MSSERTSRTLRLSTGLRLRSRRAEPGEASGRSSPALRRRAPRENTRPIAQLARHLQQRADSGPLLVRCGPCRDAVEVRHDDRAQRPSGAEDEVARLRPGQRHRLHHRRCPSREPFSGRSCPPGRSVSVPATARRSTAIARTVDCACASGRIDRRRRMRPLRRPATQSTACEARDHACKRSPGAVLCSCISFMHDTGHGCSSRARPAATSTTSTLVYRGPRGVRGRRLHGDADPGHRRARLPGGARRRALSRRDPDRAGGRARAS